MTRRPYKAHKRGTGRFVQLPEWLQQSDAWRSLKPGPRALYVELKRRYNGSNNGRITLSHREAAALLNLHRNTVGALFADLEARGFIYIERAPFLGPSGIGQSAHWSLDEIGRSGGQPPRKRFMRWQAEAPHKNQDKASAGL